MAERTPTSFKADQEMRERIEQYRRSRGMEHKSEALEELVETGLRESSPVISRLKERAFEVAFHLGLVAVVVAIAGVTTTLLTVATGLQVATILVAVGVGSLAAVECARMLSVHMEAGRI